MARFTTADQDLYVKVGYRIKQMRVAAKLTQVQMADELGLDRVTLSHMELGKVTIPIHILVWIADLLGQDISRFFTDEPVGASVDRELERIEAHLVKAMVIVGIALARGQKDV